MNWLRTLLLLVALAHVALGAVGLYVPERVAAFIGLDPLTRGALGEVRAVYGGMLAALGLVLVRAALGNAARARPWLLAAAFAYGGLVLGRFVSLGVDGFSLYTLVGGMVEVTVLGVLLFAAAELGEDGSRATASQRAPLPATRAAKNASSSAGDPARKSTGVSQDESSA